ncbi:MAG TPA: TldD/PmbA family protein [Candidatus Acidoferrales bacterium]|jgi:predicted Zn-dependent protease|nr:TldD/PmbA family protein [Candidatus Acidoferrales bacterium]
MTEPTLHLQPDEAAAEALALAEDVLGRALRVGATEAEVLVMTDDSALTRFANSEIHQNVAESSRTVNLRFVAGKRIAVMSSGRTDVEGIRSLVNRASAVVRTCEELDDWAGLPKPATGSGLVPQVGAWSDATAGASPEMRAEAVRAVIAAADDLGVNAFGSFSTSGEALAIANSAGIRVSQSRTSSQLLTVHMSPGGGNGYAEAVSTDASTIDAAALGREAAAKARASDNAVSLPPGDYPVVLEEYAVTDITDYLGFLGFSALAVQESRSFFEPGRKVGSDLVSIVDDGGDTAGLPMAFDYEGVRKQRVPLLEAGVCREVVYDSQTAARAGRTSTGHGLPAPNAYGPFPLNSVMAAGTTSRDDLIGGLDRGLLVTRFHYTNTVHPKLAIITGMTRDGTFLVEGGKITGPVRNLRFTMSYLDAIAGISAVSSSRKTLRGMLGGTVVPAVRIDAWTFTGATEH